MMYGLSVTVPVDRCVCDLYSGSGRKFLVKFVKYVWTPASIITEQVGVLISSIRRVQNVATELYELILYGGQKGLSPDFMNTMQLINCSK
jgi:hypothetical protein